MEESEEISDAITGQRDDERERRRMRDRQRRQSMTAEQRERHLARRRRNYQLRRLRAETFNSKLDIILPPELGFESGGEMVVVGQNQGLNLAPEIGVHNDGFDSIGLLRGQQQIESESLQSSGQETLENESFDVAKTFRLSRIRCLARSLNHSKGSADLYHENEPVSKSSAVTLEHGDDGMSRLSGGVRLSRFKCLARGLNTAIKETSSQEKDLAGEGTEATATCDKLMFGEPTTAGGEG